MFKTPYETTACASYDISGLQSALERAFIHGDLLPATNSNGATYVNVLTTAPGFKEVKPFTMPIAFLGNNRTQIAVDTRGYTKLDQNGKLKLVAPGEYHGQTLRAALTKAWITGLVAEMRRVNDIAPKVYIRMLSEGLIRRLNLGPADQQCVQAITGLFYFSQFEEDATLSMDDKERIAVTVARLTRIPVEMVMDFYRANTVAIANLTDYCNALREATSNPRLEKLDAATVIALMGGLWFGSNARQVMAVALEYPPIWLATIYQAMTDRSYHGSQLSKMVDNENRRRDGDQFIRDIAALLELKQDE